MILSEDQRDAIKAALGILKIKQTEVAVRLELAPSALSDMLRSGGSRSFPDSKLAELVPDLAGRLRVHQKAVGRTVRRMIDQCLDDLSELQDMNVGVGLDALTPGMPIPYSRQSGFIHPIATNLAGKLVRPIGWVHHFSGPKMGVTSAYIHAIDILEADGRHVSTIGAPPSIDNAETVEEASATLTRALHDSILGVDDDVPTVANLRGRDLQRQFILNVGNWISALPPAVGRKVKAVVVFDRLDDWLQVAGKSKFPELYDDWLQALTPLFGELRKNYRNDLSIVSACSPVALSSMMAGQSNLSLFLLGAECSDFVGIDYRDFLEISDACGLDQSDKSEEWHQYCSGSVFISHLFFFLMKKGKSESEIRTFIEDNLSGKSSKNLGIPEERSLVRSLANLKAAVLESWEIFERNLPHDASRAQDDAARIFGEIIDAGLDGKFNLPAELASSPVLEWAYRCCLLSRSHFGYVGSMLPVFEFLARIHLNDGDTDSE